MLCMHGQLVRLCGDCSVLNLLPCPWQAALEEKSEKVRYLYAPANGDGSGGDDSNKNGMCYKRCVCGCCWLFPSVHRVAGVFVLCSAEALPATRATS